MRALKEQSGRTDLKVMSGEMEAETMMADNMTKRKHAKAKSVSGILFKPLGSKICFL